MGRSLNAVLLNGAAAVVVVVFVMEVLGGKYTLRSSHVAAGEQPRKPAFHLTPTSRNLPAIQCFGKQLLRFTGYF